MPTPTELFGLAEQKKRDAKRAADKEENEKSVTLYKEALTKYREALDAKPRGFADAGYQIGLLYNKKLLPELPGKLYLILTLEYLESTISKIFRNQKKPLLTKVEQVLKVLLKEPGLTLQIKDRIFSALVSVNSKKGDRTQRLKLLSQWVLSAGTDAVQALFQYVQDEQPNNNEVKALLFFLKKDEEEEKHPARMLAIIYHAIALCNIEKLPSAFLSDEKRIVDNYNLEDIKGKATILYEQVVEEENNPIYLGRILQCLNKLKLQHTDIVNKIAAKMDLSSALRNNFQLLYEFVSYFLDNNISNQAFEYLKILSEKPEFLDKKFENFHDKFLSLCDEFDEPEQKQAFQQKLDGLYHSEDLNGGAELDENDSQSIVIYIDSLVDAAMQKNSTAMCELKTFTQGDKKHPYALAKYADVLEAVGNLCIRTKRTVYTDPFDFVKNSQKDELNDLLKQSRQIYEQQIKKGDSVACEQVADWRMFDNQLFRKNYFIARRLYEVALEGGQINVRQKLIRLYFYGKGGPADFIKTFKLLQLEKQDERLNAELKYIQGEFYLLCLYEHEHSQKDVDDVFDLSLRCFADAAALGSQNAQLSFELLKDRYDPGKKLSDIELPNFIIAKDELIKHSDSCKLRKIAERPNPNQTVAFDLLEKYYADKENGVLNLISTLCYEAQRHDDSSPEYQLLYRLICSIDPTFDGCLLKDFRQYLTEQEEQNGDYFDEYYSDDSDDEVEDLYQKGNHTVTADHDVAKEITAKLAPVGLKLARELLQRKNSDDDYDKFFKKIKDRLHSVQLDLATHKQNKQIKEDLRTLNHYSAQGRLDEALEIIDNHYRVAQLRGIYFDTSLWNQPQRRYFKSLVKHVEKDSSRSLHNKPLYSRAVYKHAGIDDFTDFSEKTLLALEKSARFVSFQMRKLIGSPAYSAGLPEEFHGAMLGRTFEDKRDQIQHLYSNNMCLFLDFIAWESGQPDAIFPNAFSPFVSTGDIQSLHSTRYAHNKAYQGLEQNRLRPQYGADGRAHRTTAGATALIISQLSDFTSDRHNHIPAMNSANRISIEELIIHERESTFLSAVESGRVKFWHLSKYPSFHRDRYYKTFHFNYGFTEPLYNELRKLILSTQPHTDKRRLTKILIDEYLSTYRSFYLWRLSHKKLAEQHDWTLFYRDRYGNFSLTPTEEVTPVPNGDSDRAGLLRFWTHRHRAEVKCTIVEDEISTHMMKVLI